MVFDPTGFPKVLTLYLELTQYPILAGRIRGRMRREIFRTGVITQEAFEAEVQEKAIQSQQREGLVDPLQQEHPDTWAQRLALIRDNLTDFYFAYNLPHERFVEIVRKTLSERGPTQEVVLTFHPELAPWDMLFAQGEAYEALHAKERTRVEHHLKEIKVVLTKAMISDHLGYVGIAKEWFDMADLRGVLDRRIGRGKIGGKAAGIILADCILRKSADKALLERLHVPRSWFLGADVFYQFNQLNGMVGFANQKYKDEKQIRAEYDSIRDQFRAGRFPNEIVDGLRSILDQVGGLPLIVRSSSLLEDSFGTSFAGKYESHFCPNQGSHEQNLKRLMDAIRNVYASVYSADVLLYRRLNRLLDYDERMAILIQEVQGNRRGDYFLPDAAGVAFSRNQFRWSPRIDRRAGFLRVVWGLGTRAVEQIGGDYPRLVALSHPYLQPDSNPEHVRRYSQRQVDVIDLKANSFRTVGIDELVHRNLPHLRLMAQRFSDGHLQEFVSTPIDLDPREAVITFDGLLRRTPFADHMRHVLQTLERAYTTPVDVEFLVLLDESDERGRYPAIHLLQCRPQSRLKTEAVELRKDIPADRRIFVSQRLVPDGQVGDVEYIVYVPPSAYAAFDRQMQIELARLIGRLNERLADKVFILIGPGRWGSDNPDLGIPVRYGDIYRARALIELASDESAPEPSYGTHFFQDLVEAHIYPLALALSDSGAEFNRPFFENAPNALVNLLPDAAAWSEAVQVIHLPEAGDGALLELTMDGDAGTAMAYLATAPQDAPD
ncbi:MAG TPA: PEP/pyruvate-binding domain-containing protein [Anaerolineales bacterium]|nr:PEP/pyruvate-binding domain-containing protein [Anaerolineales bacterium]